MLRGFNFTLKLLPQQSFQTKKSDAKSCLKSHQKYTEQSLIIFKGNPLLPNSQSIFSSSFPTCFDHSAVTQKFKISILSGSLTVLSLPGVLFSVCGLVNLCEKLSRFNSNITLSCFPKLSSSLALTTLLFCCIYLPLQYLKLLEGRKLPHPSLYSWWEYA